MNYPPSHLDCYPLTHPLLPLPCSTAINLQPSYAKAYTYLAVALAKLNDFDNSCAAYEKSLELGQYSVSQ